MVVNNEEKQDFVEYEKNLYACIKSVGIDDSCVKSKQITSLQQSNAKLPTLSNPLGNVTVDSESQSLNADVSMYFTPLGIVMSKSASQFSNTLSLIIVTPRGIVILDNEMQSSNAFSPISVI